MKCPVCGANSRVLRTSKFVERRRECFNGHRFSTVETALVHRPPARPQLRVDDAQVMAKARTSA